MKTRGRITALCLVLLLFMTGIQSGAAECGHQYETYTSNTNIRYEPAQFQYHRYIYNEYSFTICMLCGHIKSETVSEEEFEEQENHAFEDGICRKCGYENPCSHLNGTYEEITDSVTGEPGWQTIDELTHGGVGNRVRTVSCRTCREELDREVLEEGIDIVTRHSFTRGICFDCRYLNPCDHPEQIADQWMENVSNEPLDEETHRVTGELVEYSRCAVCLEELGKTDGPGTPFEAEEQHIFGDRGYCLFCGYENPCRHEGENRSSLHVFNGVCEPLNEEEHSICGKVEEVFECSLCGQCISSSVYDEQGSLIRAHVFEEGVCRDCGFANECPHELTQMNIYIDSTSVSAQENFGEAERSFERRDAYESLDKRRHLLRGDRRQATVCIDCGEILDDVLLEKDAEETEDHRMNGEGLCVLCGYVCLHEEGSFSYEDWNMLRYEPVDETCHKQTGSCYAVEACSACSAELSRRLIAKQAEMLKEHVLSEGRCTLCGAAETCRHEKVNAFAYVDGAVYGPVDELSHTVQGELTVSNMCVQCYATVPGQTETIRLSRTENHKFMQGQCMWCESPNQCAHERTRRDLYAGNAVYTPADGLTHRVSGEILASVACRECGELLEQGLSAGQDSLVEPHVFVEGACLMCGYANPCAHEETEDKIWFSGATYARLDGQSHMVFGTKYLKSSCVLCMEELSKELLADYTEESEAHFYEEGVCLYCGARDESVK